MSPCRLRFMVSGMIPSSSCHFLMSGPPSLFSPNRAQDFKYISWYDLDVEGYLILVFSILVAGLAAT